MTALIVVAVVAFIALDAFILYWVFIRKHRRADDLGVLGLPGAMTIVLPEGKVRVTYHEGRRAESSDDSIHFEVPAGFELTIISPMGEEVELEGPGFRGMGSSKSTGKGFARTLVGTYEVTQPGPYEFSAPNQLSGAVDPKLLVGK